MLSLGEVYIHGLKLETYECNDAFLIQFFFIGRSRCAGLSSHMLNFQNGVAGPCLANVAIMEISSESFNPK